MWPLRRRPSTGRRWSGAQRSSSTRLEIANEPSPDPRAPVLADAITACRYRSWAVEHTVFGKAFAELPFADHAAVAPVADPAALHELRLLKTLLGLLVLARMHIEATLPADSATGSTRPSRCPAEFLAANDPTVAIEVRLACRAFGSEALRLAVWGRSSAPASVSTSRCRCLPVFPGVSRIPSIDNGDAGAGEVADAASDPQSESVVPVAGRRSSRLPRRLFVGALGHSALSVRSVPPGPRTLRGVSSCLG